MHLQNLDILSFTYFLRRHGHIKSDVPGDVDQSGQWTSAAPKVAEPWVFEGLRGVTGNGPDQWRVASLSNYLIIECLSADMGNG